MHVIIIAGPWPWHVMYIHTYAYMCVFVYKDFFLSVSSFQMASFQLWFK